MGAEASGATRELAPQKGAAQSALASSSRLSRSGAEFLRQTHWPLPSAAVPSMHAAQSTCVMQLSASLRASPAAAAVYLR